MRSNKSNQASLLALSEEKLQAVFSRLFTLSSFKCESISVTLAISQEFLLVDPKLAKRNDLRFLNSADLFADSDLAESHRIEAIKEELVKEASNLNARIEIRRIHPKLPLFALVGKSEKASTSLAHHENLIMDLKRIASKYNLRCLFQEKPFADALYLAKRCQWAVVTEQNRNLLALNIPFIYTVLLTAILRAIAEHIELIMSAVSSFENCIRLERLSPIPVMKLGKSVAQVLQKESHPLTRTALFHLQEGTLEFSALGVSSEIPFALTVINAVIADSLQLIVDEIADVVKDRKLGEDALLKEAGPVLQKHLEFATSISDFKPKKGPSAFKALLDHKTIAAFSPILNEGNLESRYEIAVETYARKGGEELSMLRKTLKQDALAQMDRGLRENVLSAMSEIQKWEKEIVDMGWEAKARVFSELILPKIQHMQKVIDERGEVL